MQELRLRAVDPALQNARRAAAYDPGCVHELLLAEAQHATGQIGDAERREQARRMKAAAMELARRDAADPARDFVADRDGGDQLLAGDGSVLRKRQRRSDRRAAHVHDRFVVRVVELERLGQRAVHESRGPDTDALSNPEQPARSRRIHRRRGLLQRLAVRCPEPGQRQSDHIEDAVLGAFDDIGRQIVEADGADPVRELFGVERHLGHSAGTIFPFLIVRMTPP